MSTVCGEDTVTPCSSCGVSSAICAGRREEIQKEIRDEMAALVRQMASEHCESAIAITREHWQRAEDLARLCADDKAQAVMEAFVEFFRRAARSPFDAKSFRAACRDVLVPKDDE